MSSLYEHYVSKLTHKDDASLAVNVVACLQKSNCFGANGIHNAWDGLDHPSVFHFIIKKGLVHLTSSDVDKVCKLSSRIVDVVVHTKDKTLDVTIARSRASAPIDGPTDRVFGSSYRKLLAPLDFTSVPDRDDQQAIERVVLAVYNVANRIPLIQVRLEAVESADAAVSESFDDGSAPPTEEEDCAGYALYFTNLPARFPAAFLEHVEQVAGGNAACVAYFFQNQALNVVLRAARVAAHATQHRPRPSKTWSKPVCGVKPFIFKPKR